METPRRVCAFAGSCHCGAIEFTFHASRSPPSWPIRACQCRFCRGHGARTTADPDGLVTFRFNDESQLQRYRFGLYSAEFLLCRRCGVYIAAVLASPLGQFTTININAIREPLAVAEALPVSYEGESLDQRQGRREQHWTPVTGTV
jgi:hypothetical protein